jgi:lipoprotein-anchoring transpeptidase ErfK/SrfK
VSQSTTPARRPAPARRRARSRRLSAAAACCGLCLVLLPGCGGTARPQAAPTGSASPTAASPKATITVTPPAGTGSVRPDTTVEVAVAGGALTQVTVQDSDGAALPGGVSADGSRWTASARLRPGADYTVRVTAVNPDGTTAGARATFSTLRVRDGRRLKASSVSPLAGSTVGVAHPLVVGFNHPVRDRAAVQRALRVRTTPAVAGGWFWIDDEHVHYRPREFWPAGTRVTLSADLTGVDAGGGYWGAASRTVSYQIGRRQVLRIDVKRLRMTVERGGRAVRAFRVTSGKPGWETRNGTKVLMEKIRDKTWTNDEISAPEEYTLHSEYAMRMTNSGEFIHDAPWSLGNLGRRSASHGCVGMRPGDARWLYRNTMVGDAVVVTGSPRPYGAIWNRYADWNVPWSTWSAGNARG